MRLKLRSRRVVQCLSLNNPHHPCASPCTSLRPQSCLFVVLEQYILELRGLAHPGKILSRPWQLRALSLPYGSMVYCSTRVWHAENRWAKSLRGLDEILAQGSPGITFSYIFLLNPCAASTKSLRRGRPIQLLNYFLYLNPCAALTNSLRS